MDALEYFSWSKRCWLPALLYGFEGALLHLNVKREVPVVSTSLRTLSVGRYLRTALDLSRIEGAEATADVIINGTVVIRPQCRQPAGGPPRRYARACIFNADASSVLVVDQDAGTMLPGGKLDPGDVSSRFCTSDSKSWAIVVGS